MLHGFLPDDAEVAGLLALMLLTGARRAARTGPHGELVPMAEQDRALWNADQIAEGIALITEALFRGRTGPYQLQAAIAAVHDEAPDADATDGPQMVALYELLVGRSDTPVVALNHAVRWPWPRARSGGSSSWEASSGTSESPMTIGSTPCAPTCWRWPAIVRAPGTLVATLMDPSDGVPKRTGRALGRAVYHGRVIARQLGDQAMQEQLLATGRSEVTQHGHADEGARRPVIAEQRGAGTGDDGDQFRPAVHQ
jgi:hypothetical protein